MIKKELALPVPFLFYSFALRHWREKIPHSAECGRRPAAKGGCACFEGPFLRKKGPSPKKRLGRAGSAFRPPRSASLPKNPPHRAPLQLFVVRSSYSTSYSTLLHQFVAAQAGDSKLPHSPTQEQKKVATTLRRPGRREVKLWKIAEGMPNEKIVL